LRRTDGADRWRESTLALEHNKKEDGIKKVKGGNKERTKKKRRKKETKREEKEGSKK
jgi:hypothetical protein